MKTSNTLIQPKLTINSKGNHFEQEADALAERVTQMPPSKHVVKQVTGLIGRSVQRKCASCEEEEKKKRIMRKESTGESGLSVSSSFFSSLNASKGSGSPLPTATRGFMENAFSADFSSVRVHADSQASEMSKGINAKAFTYGNDIYFNSGEYSSNTKEGKKLLAHELTHTLQQINGNFPIQRFGSDEHRRIGDVAVGGNTLITAYGRITFGEMIAMAGDYFSSIEEIASLAESGIQSNREQIDYVLWKVNPTRTRPSVSQTAIDAVEDRYNRLAANNESHFSTGSSAGNSNRERYISMHTRAINDAFQEGFNPLVVRRWNWHATEAFAQHYLTDAFSAGHVRTERGNIQRYWNSLYPNFTDNMINMISCFMASHINDRDTIGYIYTVDALTAEIVPVVRSLGGSTLTSFSIGDLISKVLHDADNAGLDVVSPRGPAGSIGGSPFRWRAIGDDHLFAPAGTTASTAQQQTQQMMSEAMRLSNDEGSQADTAGRSYNTAIRTRLLNPANFRALSLIPSVDTTSTTNPNYAWRASSLTTLPSNIQSLITSAFAPGAEVRRGLDSISVDCITTNSGFDLHTRDAFNCFKGKLLGNLWATILEIAAGSPLCPPGQNDFCPTMRNACP